MSLSKPLVGWIGDKSSFHIAICEEGLNIVTVTEKTMKNIIEYPAIHIKVNI